MSPQPCMYKPTFSPNLLVHNISSAWKVLEARQERENPSSPAGGERGRQRNLKPPSTTTGASHTVVGECAAATSCRKRLSIRERFFFLNLHFYITTAKVRERYSPIRPHSERPRTPNAERILQEHFHATFFASSRLRSQCSATLQLGVVDPPPPRLFGPNSAFIIFHFAAWRS